MSGVRLGTKAETLQALRGKLKRAEIPPLDFFTVGDWRADGEGITARIRDTFTGVRIAIRSSAQGEDGADSSMAGAFESVLDVDSGSTDDLSEAIEAVVSAYSDDDSNQVLIQEMVGRIAVSGVATTHVLSDGAPYYVLNYDDESGRTDTVTGGIGVHKTVLIHRNTDPSMIESGRVQDWLGMIRELEGLIGDVPLDIEFAQDQDGTVHLLQARRISAAKNWVPEIGERVFGAMRYIERFVTERSRRRPGLVGSRTILGEMTDWNPAEIIGTRPRQLAATLYRHLVTDRVWRRARASMGYRHPEAENLMIMIGGRPYIDVRNSFNSFLPATLGEETAEAVVEAWLDRLEAHPELHDKVEFDVCHTTLDFDFEYTMRDRYGHRLTPTQVADFRRSLFDLTRGCLEPSPEGTLARALDQVRRLETLQSEYPRRSPSPKENIDFLVQAASLLEDCVSLGTLPFAVIARHAFIAEAFLRSAVRRGGLTQTRFEAFKRSLTTVSGELSRDFRMAAEGSLDRGEFLRGYGHLRPGTYDVLSLRYDQRPDIFEGYAVPDDDPSDRSFQLTLSETQNLEQLLAETGFTDIAPEDLLNYARLAIVGREKSKFVFTRNLSDAMESLVGWGERLGLSRDDVSHLPLNAVLDCMHSPILEDELSYFKTIAELGRTSVETALRLHLSYLIRGTRDVWVVPLHRGAPNFITCKRIEGDAVQIHNRMSKFPDLRGMIVCVENADPGFDWIFTRGIAALITKFGGTNSHMAIRCAEFGLPAAIGVGEQTFSRLVEARKVEINCAAKILRPLYG